MLLAVTHVAQLCVCFSNVVLYIVEQQHETQQNTMLCFHGDEFICIVDSNIFKSTEQRENVCGFP
jgi:hypothetical protein